MLVEELLRECVRMLEVDADLMLLMEGRRELA